MNPGLDVDEQDVVDRLVGALTSAAGQIGSREGSDERVCVAVLTGVDNAVLTGRANQVKDLVCALAVAVHTERYEEVLAAMTDEELHATCQHPDFEYETTEGQRKAWDDSDRPPDGEGWVRNRHVGRNGWERFAYTEESYWMRPRDQTRTDG